MLAMPGEIIATRGRKRRASASLQLGKTATDRRSIIGDERTDENSAIIVDGQILLFIEVVTAKSAGRHGDIGKIPKLLVVAVGAWFDVGGDQEIPRVCLAAQRAGPHSPISKEFLPKI